MISLLVNGKTRIVDADPDMPLLWVLRDLLNLSGTKYGCGIGACGACTVHLNGEATRSCATPVKAARGKPILTVEGVGAIPPGRALQASWDKLDVVQCGYCQPGQIMSAAALLVRNRRPSDADIDEAMRGNACRCATYLRIRAAIKDAAGALA